MPVNTVGISSDFENAPLILIRVFQPGEFIEFDQKQQIFNLSGILTP